VARGRIADGFYGIYETYELNESEVFPDLKPVGTSSCSSGTPDLIRSESPNRLTSRGRAGAPLLVYCAEGDGLGLINGLSKSDRSVPGLTNGLAKGVPGLGLGDGLPK
jgi:hypothetical protein